MTAGNDDLMDEKGERPLNLHLGLLSRHVCVTKVRPTTYSLKPSGMMPKVLVFYHNSQPHYKWAAVKRLRSEECNTDIIQELAWLLGLQDYRKSKG